MDPLALTMALLMQRCEAQWKVKKKTRCLCVHCTANKKRVCTTMKVNVVSNRNAIRAYSLEIVFFFFAFAIDGIKESAKLSGMTSMCFECIFDV